MTVAAIVQAFIAVFLGGGSVQLIIFLARRRAEIKGLDSQSGAVSLEASDKLITQLQLDGGRLRTQVDNLQVEHLRETEEMTRRLISCNDQIVRLQREIALLRNDLGIAQHQLDQLGRQPPTPGPGGHRRIY